MKMVHATNETQSEGLTEVKQTGVGGDAKIVHALLTGMVKDKVIYPVREYATNAWEISPPKKPFEIDLPTKFNPEYRIRDFGPGLSHSFMMKRYGKIGDSTKDADDEAIGGWGFGSKSGLAYLLRADGCGQLNVTSRHKGFRRVYVIGVSEQGKIQTGFIGEWPLEAEDRGTGLEVSFAVRPDDINRFHECAQDVLWSFHPRPVITPAIDFGTPKILHKGDGWTLYDRRTVPFYGPQVQIGPVRYPIDMDLAPAISGLVTEDDTIVFNAPVGTISVSASREALQYDDRTEAGLRTMFAHYEQDWMVKARAAVDAETRYFNAWWKAREIANSVGYERGWNLVGQIGWRGFSFRDKLFTAGGIAKPAIWGEWPNRKPRGGDTYTFAPKWDVNPAELAQLKVVIQHNTARTLERIEAAGLIDERFLLVRCRKADREAVLERMGNPEYQLLDDTKLPKLPPGSGKAKRPENLKRMRILSKDMKSSAGKLIDTDQEIVWVRAEGRGSRRYLNSTLDGETKRLGLDTAKRYVNRLTEAGLLDHDFEIVTLGDHEHPLPHWRSFADHIIELVDGALDVSQVAPVIPWNKDSFPQTLRYLRKYNVDLGCAPQAVRDVYYGMVSMGEYRKQLDREPTVHDSFAAILLELAGKDVKLKENDPTAPLREKWTEIVEQMPALPAIIEHYKEQTYDYKRQSYVYKLEDAGQKALDHYWGLFTK